MIQKIILSFSLLLAVSVAYAGPRITGNGGDAVVCRNADKTFKSVELLDFYEGREERGIQSTLNPQLSVAENVDVLIARLGVKGRYLQADLQKFNLSFMSEAKFFPNITLVDIQDSDHLIVPTGCAIEQIAIQSEPKFPQDMRYKISKDLWDQMDNANKAGLIVHEIMYRYLISKSSENDEINSINVRYINSLLSADQIQGMTLGQFINWVANSIHLNKVSFDDYAINVRNIQATGLSVTSFCGVPEKGKTLVFPGDIRLTILLDMKSNVCFNSEDLSKKIYKISLSNASQGTYSMYSFFAEPNTDIEFTLNTNNQIIDLKNFNLELNTSIYNTDRLFCKRIEITNGQPDLITCIGIEYLNEYFATKYPEGDFQSKTTIKNNLIISYDLIEESGKSHYDFYPSGYLKSGPVWIMDTRFSDSELNLTFRLGLSIGLGVPSYYSGEAIFYDGPGLILRNHSGSPALEGFPYNLKDDHSVLRRIYQAKFQPDLHGGFDFYSNGQIVKILVSKIAPHNYGFQDFYTKKKNGDVVKILEGNIIIFDENGEIIDIN